MQYTPEELLGMVLNYSRGLAEDFAGLHIQIGFASPTGFVKSYSELLL